MEDLESIRNMGKRLANEVFITFNNKLNEFNDKAKADSFKLGFEQQLMLHVQQLRAAEKEEQAKESSEEHITR